MCLNSIKVIAMALLSLTLCSCGQQKPTLTIHTDINGLSQYLKLPGGVAEAYWCRIPMPVSKEPSARSPVPGPADLATMAIIIMQPEKYDAYLNMCTVKDKSCDKTIAGCYIQGEFKTRLAGKMTCDSASDTYHLHSDQTCLSPDGAPVFTFKNENMLVIIP